MGEFCTNCSWDVQERGSTAGKGDMWHVMLLRGGAMEAQAADWAHVGGIRRVNPDLQHLHQTAGVQELMGWVVAHTTWSLVAVDVAMAFL